MKDGNEKKRRVIFILNPNAKSGYSVQKWNEIAGELAKIGWAPDVDYKLYITKKATDATNFAKSVTGASDVKNGSTELILGVLGGDGTLDEVVNGIVSFQHTKLLYIPAGSGNDFARSTGCDYSPEEIVKILTDPVAVTKGYDLGCLEVMKPISQIRTFCESAGIGYDAQVCKDLRFSALKKFLNHFKLGKLSYSVVGAMAILKTGPVKGWLDADGERINFERFYFASVHVHPYEGGGFKFAPDADATDGMLDVCLVSGISKFGFFNVLLHALLKKHGREKGVKIIRCRKCKIHLNQPKQTHCDGELLGIQNDIAFVTKGKRILQVLGR